MRGRDITFAIHSTSPRAIGLPRGQQHRHHDLCRRRRTTSALSSLTTNAGARPSQRAPSTTTGNQTYHDAVTSGPNRPWTAPAAAHYPWPHRHGAQTHGNPRAPPTFTGTWRTTPLMSVPPLTRHGHRGRATTRAQTIMRTFTLHGPIRPRTVRSPPSPPPRDHLGRGHDRAPHVRNPLKGPSLAPRSHGQQHRHHLPLLARSLNLTP